MTINDRARERYSNNDCNIHDVRFKINDETKQDLDHALHLINSRRKKNENPITISEICREYLRTALDVWFIAERFK